MTAHCQDCAEKFEGLFWWAKAAWHWIRFTGQDVT